MPDKEKQQVPESVYGKLLKMGPKGLHIVPSEDHPYLMQIGPAYYPFGIEKEEASGIMRPHPEKAVEHSHGKPMIITTPEGTAYGNDELKLAPEAALAHELGHAHAGLGRKALGFLSNALGVAGGVATVGVGPAVATKDVALGASIGIAANIPSSILNLSEEAMASYKAMDLLRAAGASEEELAKYKSQLIAAFKTHLLAETATTLSAGLPAVMTGAAHAVLSKNAEDNMNTLSQNMLIAFEKMAAGLFEGGYSPNLTRARLSTPAAAPPTSHMVHVTGPGVDMHLRNPRATEGPVPAAQPPAPVNTPPPVTRPSVRAVAADPGRAVVTSVPGERVSSDTDAILSSISELARQQGPEPGRVLPPPQAAQKAPPPQATAEPGRVLPPQHTFKAMFQPVTHLEPSHQVPASPQVSPQAPHAAPEASAPEAAPANAPAQAQPDSDWREMANDLGTRLRAGYDKVVNHEYAPHAAYGALGLGALGAAYGGARALGLVGNDDRKQIIIR